MPATFSANKGYELMANGEESGTWGGVTNDNWDIVDLNLGGVLNLSLSNVNVTLSASQAQNVVYQLSGAMTGNVQITWPASKGGFFIVRNATSGAFTVTLASAGAGASVTITQGTTRLYYTDGTNIREAPNLGTLASQNANAVAITGGTIAGVTISGATISSSTISSLNAALGVAYGGTGGTSQATARSGLGLGTAATVNTGNSGATVPLCNGTPIFSNNIRMGTTNVAPGIGNSDNGLALTDHYVAASNASTEVDSPSYFNTIFAGGFLSSLRFRGEAVGSIKVSGSGSGVNYNSNSDYRLKTQVRDLDLVGHMIDALRPVRFRWRSDGSEDVGFLAHEYAAVIPQGVTGEMNAVDENGKPIWQQLDDSTVIPYLVREIQSLRQRVLDLESR